MVSDKGIESSFNLIDPFLYLIGPVPISRRHISCAIDLYIIDHYLPLILFILLLLLLHNYWLAIFERMRKVHLGCFSHRALYFMQFPLFSIHIVNDELLHLVAPLLQLPGCLEGQDRRATFQAFPLLLIRKRYASLLPAG